MLKKEASAQERAAADTLRVHPILPDLGEVPVRVLETRHNTPIRPVVPEQGREPQLFKATLLVREANPARGLVVILETPKHMILKDILPALVAAPVQVLKAKGILKAEMGKEVGRGTEGGRIDPVRALVKAVLKAAVQGKALLILPVPEEDPEPTEDSRAIPRALEVGRAAGRADKACVGIHPDLKVDREQDTIKG